jgi:hypothetical protein
MREDEAREQKAAAEEIDTEGVKDTGAQTMSVSSLVGRASSHMSYRMREKKATRRPCCALNRMRICFSSCFGSLDALVTAPFSMKSEGRESCWISEALQEVIIHKEKEGESRRSGGGVPMDGCGQRRDVKSRKQP